MPDPVTYPTSGGVNSCDAIALSQSYFLGLFDRTYPLGYLFPMKTTPNGGYELFKGIAKVGERVSLAIERLECGSLIIFAPLGVKATGQVRISRPTAAAGAVTVKKGSSVTTDDGRDFLIQDDVVFGALDVGPHDVDVVAVSFGYEYNLPGQVTTAGGELLPGAINQFKVGLLDPPYADTTLVVTQPNPTSGGTAALLEGLGADRGIPYNGEDIEIYRLKVRTLPDVVSPGAIRRLLTNIFGINHFCFREVGTPLLRGVFFDGGTGVDVSKIDYYDENTFVFTGVLTTPGFMEDEPIYLLDASSNIIADGYFGKMTLGNTRFFFIPRTTRSRAVIGAGTTIFGRISGSVFTPAAVLTTVVNQRRFRVMFDYVSFRAFFLIGVPRLSDGEFGIPYDTPFPWNAYDNTTSSNPEFTNFFDGFPYIAFQFYQSVYNQVAAVKAAGVGFDLYIESIGCT